MRFLYTSRCRSTLSCSFGSKLIPWSLTSSRLPCCLLRTSHVCLNTRQSSCSVSCSRVLLEKLTGFPPVQKFPAFYGTPRFITAFTSAYVNIIIIIIIIIIIQSALQPLWVLACSTIVEYSQQEGFYRVPLPAARQTPNLEDQWLERSNSRHQASPHAWNDASETQQRKVSLVSVVCCQVDVSASGWSLVQRSHTGPLFILELFTHVLIYYFSSVLLYHDAVSCSNYTASVMNEWVWSGGGMITTDQIGGRKSSPSATLSTAIQRRPIWDSTRAFVVTGRRLTNRAMAGRR